MLQERLAELPPQRLQEIRRNMDILRDQTSRPITCPLLDVASGSCPVYAQRPVACRSYGYYVQRDKGLFCPDIEARVAGGALADVVWSNHDAVDQRLGTLGESRALTEWFERWLEVGQ